MAGFPLIQVATVVQCDQSDRPPTPTVPKPEGPEPKSWSPAASQDLLSWFPVFNDRFPTMQTDYKQVRIRLYRGLTSRRNHVTHKQSERWQNSENEDRKKKNETMITWNSKTGH